MKYVVAFALLIFFSTNTNAQRWTKMGKSPVAEKGIKDIVPDDYLLVKVDDEAIKDILWSAPQEKNVSPSKSTTLLSVMDYNGQLTDFSIVEYDMMEIALKLKFPNIKTFIGVAKGNKKKTIRIDYTVHGLRAVINDDGHKTYIDHYQRGDKSHKVVYTRKGYQNNNLWSCLLEDGHSVKEKEENSERMSGDCVLRNFELAMATTGEYSNFHGATSAADAALVTSAVLNVINRINEVYEVDVSTRFTLIGNTDLLFYYDSGSDPYTNNNGVAMLSENQTNVDNVIGNGNYDIGHVFSTGGGGVASLRSLCNISSKARGVTGLGQPVGDPFAIDYVAHEIGHQCGGPHTYNNFCGGQRSDDDAVEPGSGSTIMAYANICAPNVQSASDAYFHAFSIASMNADITNENQGGEGNTTCAETITWNNTAPEIVGTVQNKTLPISTPFVLETMANDVDGDPITYCWEQIDIEIANMPPASTNNDGPAFRSFSPTSNPKRYFPALTEIINGNSPTWEVLPSVNRTMNFRGTIRDIHNGMGGCTDETEVELTFSAASGPFLVQVPNGGESYLQNETVTVTWDAAGTANAPVSCANVEILLSTDAGMTYPTVLLASTTNNGNADVTMPMINASTCRIMIKCGDNYFFDISNADFQITDGTGPRCAVLNSSDVPVAISENGTPTITSDLTIRDRGIISDLNVLDLSGDHTYVADLSFDLQKGTGTSINIMDFSDCNGQNNFDLNLDDEATSGTYPCPPIGGNTYQPLNPLSGFDGLEAKGDWTLTVNDGFNADGGNLQSWGLEYCSLDLCDLTVNTATYAGFGSISEAIDCAIAGDTIWLENAIPGQEINIGANSLFINKDITIFADVPTTFTSTNPMASVVVNTGNTVSLVGFTIVNTNNLGVQNNGTLTMEDMTVITNGTTEQVQNTGNGNISVKGICNFRI